MTRQKKPRLVIAFNTTTAAMAFDDICKLGRLIPLPSKVKAGCGLAYCAELEFENAIDDLLNRHNIDYFAKQVVDFY